MTTDTPLYTATTEAEQWSPDDLPPPTDWPAYLAEHASAIGEHGADPLLDGEGER